GTISMNLGFRNRARRRKKIKIASFIGLADVLRVQRAVAARVSRRGLLPGGAATGNFLFGHVKVDSTRGAAPLDLVTGPDEGKRSADEAFRRNMKNAGSIAGAAHARVRNAQHVANALLQQLFRDRQHAPFRHAWAALGAAVLKYENMIGCDVKSIALDLARHMIVVVEGDDFAAVAQQSLVGRRGL